MILTIFGSWEKNNTSQYYNNITIINENMAVMMFFLIYNEILLYHCILLSFITITLLWFYKKIFYEGCYSKKVMTKVKAKVPHTFHDLNYFRFMQEK